METKQVSFHMPADEWEEFSRHVKRMNSSKSGVIRSLIHDWMAWRRSVQAKELAEKEAAGLKVDWSTAEVSA